MKNVLTKKRIVTILLILIILVIIWFIFSNLFYKYRPYYSVKNRNSNIEKFKFSNNEKAKGWLRVQGTNIDMAIMDYYDVYDISDPTYNIGWYSDYYKPESDRIILYSHNMRNVSSKPLIANEEHERFEQLMSFIYYDFAKKNEYIQYSANKENNLYKIYAVYLIKNDAFTEEDDFDSSSKDKYIESAISRSYFKYNVDVSSKDKLLTLKTCTRFYGNDEYGFVVEARKLRKNEIISKYRVSKNKKYKKVEKVLKGDE